MKTPKTLTHGLLAGLAILNVSMASIAQAGPNTLTRGSHGAAYIPAMSSDFPMMAMKYKMNVTPFNLVFLAFQGFFMSEGIPSDEGLIRAYQEGKLSPEDLTKAAISMNRLPAAALTDKDYLSSVKSQLDSLTRPN